MEVLDELGLPAGVANLVLGAGATVGSRRCPSNPDVDLVSFTGGLETGKIIAAAAAATVKKVALELGGKNPNVVFADADFDAAAGQRAQRRVRPLRPGLLRRRAPGHRGIDRRPLRRRAGAPRRADPPGRPVRPGRRDRAADLRRPPRQGDRLRGQGHRRGRQPALRRRRWGDRRAREGLLLPAHRPRPGHQRHVRRRRRGLRARWSPSRPSPPRTRPSASPTTPHYGLAGAVWSQDAGKRPAGRPAGCATAPSGSTTSTPTCRRRSGAASASPASAASSAPRAWPSTRKPSTSTRTSTRR